MYILAYKKKKSNNISSFKIQDNFLNMFITPVEDCVVDFGDGTKQIYTGNNSSTNVEHSYSESNIYTIKITGNHSNFIASQNTIEIIQLADSVTSCVGMFTNCWSLTTIPSTFTIPNSVTDCSYMFTECSSLTTIPSTFTIPNSVTNCSCMFSGCSSLTTIQEGFTLGNSVTDCSAMFVNCSKITEIPETLIIPDSVTNCSDMFSVCSSLTSDISNIWPEEFTYTETINVEDMFNGCSKVVGTVPADKLWNSGKTFNSTGCFGNCTSLTNYNDIPAGWK